jgi:hypothetical protein
MQTIQNGYRGLSMLVDLNLDRFLTIGTLLAALLVGGYIGSL